jgi:SNF2 family DNA or RNA helicase
MAVHFVLHAISDKMLIAIPKNLALIQALITPMNGFPEKAWSKQRQGWKIPVTQPNITYLRNTWREDEYELKENAKILLQYEEVLAIVEEKRATHRWEYLFENKASTYDPPVTRKPFMHQLVAVESCMGSEAFGLLMEMGTGKTKVIGMEINILSCHMQGNEMIRAVIVCPKALRENWRRELEMEIPDLHNYTIEILNGDAKSLRQIGDALMHEGRIKILIVSYDSVPTMLDQLLAFRPTYVAFDESHYVKNPEAQRSKACNVLSRNSTMRRILTGTPVSNNILDLYHQFELLRPGCLGFATFTAFKREYADIENHGGFEVVVGYNEAKVDALKEHMARLSFVVKKERCLDLPAKTYEVRLIEMSEQHRIHYQQMAQEFMVLLESGEETKTEHMIVQMLKLSQIACGFMNIKELDMHAIQDENDPVMLTKTVMIPGGDNKLNAMLDDIEDVVANNSKVIVWSRFKLDARILRRKLKERGIYAVSFIDADDEARQRAVDAFNTDDNCKVFIGMGSG